ncbi:MAG: hypothetical protein ACXVH1_27995 [Solirubrobacteraceae bacterium]
MLRAADRGVQGDGHLEVGAFREFRRQATVLLSLVSQPDACGQGADPADHEPADRAHLGPVDAVRVCGSGEL